jgi:glutathione S-transferase
MITLYYAPRTRAVRIRWLLEELELPYELRRVAFVSPSSGFFVQTTPTRKLPAIEDGDVTVGESGAIIEYVLERYGDGRLAPPVGSPARAPYLQWLHFAEGTLSVPLSTILWHLL